MPPTARALTLSATALLLALLPRLGADAEASPRHFELQRSVPAAEAVLAEPPRHVQLWFSQEPQLEGARIRVVDASGDLVEMGPTAAVPDTATSLRAEVRASLSPGAYAVHWRAMARDGHLVTGEIPFEVAGAPLR